MNVKEASKLNNINENTHFETLQVHAGRYVDPLTGTCTTPIHQTDSYIFKSIQHAKDLFNLQKDGYIYTRLSNPTTDVFEKRVAALEHGTAALATASGQAAQFLTIQNLAKAGDNIISCPSLYGGSFTQFSISFAQFGVDFRFPKKKDDLKSYEELIDENTKAIFVETIGNSDYYIPDFDGLAALCSKYKLPLIVDNTFGAGGYLFRPADYGAAVVTNSATKWIGGHGNSIAGIIIDGGNFDWGSGRFPQIAEPCPTYHGLSFWKACGGAQAAGTETGEPNTAFVSRARALGIRDWGCCLSPMNAFLLLQGVETLSLRMERICANSLELASWLERHPKVESVNYPGLKSNRNHKAAVKYFGGRGFGGVFSFSLRGDKEYTSRFVEHLQLITHLVNVGDNKTLISHSASTTHGQMSPEALKAAGIGESMLRISVGIEHIDDLKYDISQAFESLK